MIDKIKLFFHKDQNKAAAITFLVYGLVFVILSWPYERAKLCAGLFNCFPSYLAVVWVLGFILAFCVSLFLIFPKRRATYITFIVTLCFSLIVGLLFYFLINSSQYGMGMGGGETFVIIYLVILPLVLPMLSFVLGSINKYLYDKFGLNKYIYSILFVVGIIILLYNLL